MKKINKIFMSFVTFLLTFSPLTVSATHVAPTTLEDFQAGNAVAECAQVGTYQYAFKIDDWTGSISGDHLAQFEDEHSNTINISNNDGTYFDWSSSPNSIGAVIVKGGPKANVFSYDPQVSSDSQLYSPNNPGGNVPTISHVTFCWNLDEQPEEPSTQWCSPGYWRQDHHFNSWPASFDKTTPYPVDTFGSLNLSKKALKDGNVSETPTLWEVLQSPQWYGGEAFNNVGDLLSTAHPGVNFQGERVEDSCPLN